MKYPLGVQTFSKLILQNYVYVDKTALIQKLVDDGEWYFLSRPRRFGKSVLVSTLDALFRGKKTLFDGLAISHTDYAFDEHPVIKLEFTKAKILDATSFEAFISEQVTTLASEHQISLTSERFERQFDQLVSGLHRQTGKTVVLLIDEYDKPLLNTLETDQLTDVKVSMNAFYGMVKAMDEHLRFVFITGVSKFSKVSVFSGMNNLTDISTEQRYATLCGYTQQELEQNFNAVIENYAADMNLSPEALKLRIQQWYNGYCFHFKGSKVYNPYSILSFFRNGEFNNYWFQTATPTFLINRLKASEYDLSKIDTLHVGEGVFDAVEPENMGITPMLLQTGYLTIKHFNAPLYQLGFPNMEVELSFYNSLLADYSRVDVGTAQGYVVELRDALKNQQLKKWFASLKQFFAGIPYTITLKQEKYYQSLFFAVCRLLGEDIEAEVHTNQGRIDCVLQTQSHIYIVEFKLNGTKEEALQQIKDKHYAQKYQGLGKQIILLGVEFDQQTRNIGGWLEEDG